MSGKGSKRRKGEKIRRFCENFDQIDWAKPKLTKEQMVELITVIKKWPITDPGKS
jgi:hypothetical protein